MKSKEHLLSILFQEDLSYPLETSSAILIISSTIAASFKNKEFNEIRHDFSERIKF